MGAGGRARDEARPADVEPCDDMEEGYEPMSVDALDAALAACGV